MAARFANLRGDRAGISEVYVNGEFTHPEQARISPFDRGFIFGDGVYEVIPVFGGRLFRLQHHLQRLRSSLAAISLPEPLSAAEWESVLRRLVDENGGGDQSLYLQVTRGVAPRNHAFPADTQPTVFAYAQRMSFPAADTSAAGVSVITADDIRWQRCDIKSTSLLAAVLLRQQAVAQGCVETVLVRDGLVTEGAASNVFIVRGQRLITPPNGPFILPGITRDLVLELARRHGIHWQERAVAQDELAVADEVWLTSSTQEIKAVTRINNMPVGDGRSGVLYARLNGLYQDYKQAVREGKAE